MSPRKNQKMTSAMMIKKKMMRKQLKKVKMRKKL